MGTGFESWKLLVTRFSAALKNTNQCFGSALNQDSSWSVDQDSGFGIRIRFYTSNPEKQKWPSKEEKIRYFKF